MYATVITRHSGNSHLKTTAPPSPAFSSSTGVASPSTYHRLPTSTAGNSSSTTGRYDTHNARSQCAPTHASEAPTIPPRL